jgi:hypothetical protein
MPPSCPSHTDEAFYAIGRNVVNFQRLEQILKRLALLAPICAPLSKLQSALETRKEKSQWLTLGNAVKNWIESASHKRWIDRANDPTKPLLDQQPDNEVIVSFGFELPWSPDYFDQLSAELESLATERNSLIHLELAQLNFEDEAECVALSMQLNTQNDRILRAIEVLGPTLTRLQDMARVLTSDVIIREMIGPVNPELEVNG